MTIVVKCRRHEWVVALLDVALGEPHPVRCLNCDKPRDIVRSRRGKSASRRGKDYERALAQSLGGVKVGHLGGPEDVRAGMFNVQSKVRKAFPEWQWNELAKLPRTGGKVPLLVVADAPGPGYRRRAMVVLTLSDWVDLHGPSGTMDSVGTSDTITDIIDAAPVSASPTAGAASRLED